MDRFVIRKNKAPPASAASSTPRESPSGPLLLQSSSPEDSDPDDPPCVDDDDNSLSSQSSENESAKIIQISKRKKIYKQKFREPWKTTFPWLECKDGNNFCRLCNISLAGSKFHLRRHEKSSLHVKVFKVASSTPKIDVALTRKSNHLSIQIKRAEAKLAAYVCYKNLPFTVLDDLPQLCGDIFTDSKIAKSIKMKRNKATKIVTNDLGPKYEQEVFKELQSNKFSLIIDESTDVGQKKSLVLLARSWKNNHVKDKFLSLIQVSDCTANGLFQAVKNLLDKYEVPYENLIGFGADNANVMMGDLGGVQALLKTISPNIIVQGCSCDSLHICASEATKKLPNTVEQFIRDIYSYFKNSSKRCERFSEHQVFMEEKPHKMLKPSQTRWLSLHMVVNRILEHYGSLKSYFEEEAESLPVAKSILNALKNPIFQIYLLFLSYILELIIITNKELQSESPKLPFILDRIKLLYKQILKGFIKKEVLDQTELHNININNPRSYVELKNLACGTQTEFFLNTHQNSIDQRDLHNFHLRVLEFYIELARQIRSRFDFKDKLLMFASNFTPAKAISGDVQSINDVILYIPSLSRECNLERANIEWQLIPEVNELKTVSNNLDVFWEKVNSSKNLLGEPMFPNVMTIVKAVLCLPHSSAAAERIFSFLAIIKTKIRNSLTVETCSNIIHVKQSKLHS